VQLSLAHLHAVLLLRLDGQILPCLLPGARTSYFKMQLKQWSLGNKAMQ
jgi:hypothetical protein